MKRRRFFLVLLATFVLTGIARPAPAALMAFNYTGPAQNGGTLSGTVVGNDLDNSGFFTFPELTQWTLNWSGTASVPAFNHTLANLIGTPSNSIFNFSFHFNTGIGGLLSCSVVLGNTCDFNSPWIQAAGANAFISIIMPTASGNVGATVTKSFQTVTATTLPPISVAEPGTLVLFAIGLAGFGFLGGRRRS